MVLRQVLGLLVVDVEVPVARHPEGGAVDHGEAGEELAGVVGDDLVEERVGPPGAAREPEEARQHRRHLDHRQELLGAAHLAPPAAPQEERHVERLVAELREGVALGRPRGA